MGLNKKKEAMVEAFTLHLPLLISLNLFKMMVFFIGLHIRVWKTMWDAIVPTKLTTFGWRLCRAILREIFAIAVHWFEFAVRHITNEDFEWLLIILWALCNFRNRNFVLEKDRGEKEKLGLSSERSKPTVFPVRTRWNPPPRGLYKVNFDVTFDGNGKRGGIGIIIRDNEGFVWGGAAIKIGKVMEASVGGAMATLKALEVARDMGCRRIILESDCVGILSDSSMKVVAEGSGLRCRVDEGKMVMGEVEECYIHHIQREGNEVANLIARHSLVSQEDLFWQHDYPNFIHQAIISDAINV
ncbi:hypothetical protein HRI_004866100 [Hibiscus trionum]|uniref:RNase H type-1 domain-containing protein n=1 Tax=Hibiscus trionum TaxID=183268 RepID=A0A9W7JI16_HIBTR|nr:hypothetical protein HRI_004866100 [Hibiscus trionum]